MARQKSKIGRKTFGFRLDPNIVKQLKIIAVQREQATNELLEEGIKNLLKKYSKEYSNI
jgi:predicted transcriptional regulator